MKKTYQIMGVACIAIIFSVGAFGVTLTPSTKMTSAQVKKELEKTRSDIKKLENIKQKKSLSSMQTKNLNTLQKKELRLINRDIQLNPSAYIQERKKLEARRKTLKDEIAQKEKVGSAPMALHAELAKVNEKIDRTKTIYEIRADRNRDLYLWGKDQEKNIEKELEKTKSRLQQQGLSESVIQKKIDDLRETEKATLKSKVDNLKKEYDKELLQKYGYKSFPTPTREEIERVGVEESKVLAGDIKKLETLRREKR